jgi:hypothetical protein
MEGFFLILLKLVERLGIHMLGELTGWVVRGAEV